MDTTYRFLQGRKTFDIRIGERDIPAVGEHQVLVRVIACGVCGSDVHILRNYPAYTPLGHEIAARVVKVGPAVADIREGAQVVVEDVTFCGRCERCQSGRTDLCRHLRTLDGQSGMGEYLLVDESLVVPADGVDPARAALTEPLAVALNTVLAARLAPAANILVFGLGALGIMCVALARHFGAGTIVAVGSRRGSGRNTVREDTVRSMGADAVFYSADACLAGQVGEALAGQADAVIVTSPPSSLPTAAGLAGYGAPVVMIGLDMGGHSSVTLDVDHLVFNKNAIIPVLAEPARLFPQSLRLIRDGSIDVARLVTHRFTLDSVESLRDAYENDSGIIKALFTTGR